MAESRKRLLIVEDDPDIQEILKFTLECEGFLVHTAENGRVALDRLSQISPPNLILLDLMMPVMNGWEFEKTVSGHEEWSKIPILVLTAYSDKARSMKGREVFAKPVDLDVLLPAVHRYCAAAVV